jgi:hypothetical protein
MPQESVDRALTVLLVSEGGLHLLLSSFDANDEDPSSSSRTTDHRRGKGEDVSKALDSESRKLSGQHEKDDVHC